MGFLNSLRHAWNAFTDNDRRENDHPFQGYGMSFGLRPDRFRTTLTNERSIISAIYTRLGIDVASAELRHARKDKNRRFTEEIESGLNECLNVEANIDQAASAFRQDIAMTLFDKGVIAIVPVETSANPNKTGGYDIKTLRVAEITAWYPKHVRVKLWNEDEGTHQEIVVAKRTVAIIENPLYSVMNEHNSILQRIIRKLQLLDAVDEAAGSGKLDLIIQLPYVIKSKARMEQAEERRAMIETQLKGSKYGIAYTDGTERITQLNRPAENNMLKQIEFLMDQLYGQLGLAKSIFDGTADEATMLNYHTRTVEPVLRAITEGMTRSFLTKTARSQGQTIMYLRDPFKLVPISQIAEIGDKLTRNEILSSNEVRGIMGFRPSDDPNADKLLNKNLPIKEGSMPMLEASYEEPIELTQIRE